jgi:hypothetical protein
VLERVSVDRFAVHPVDEVLGGKSSHAGCVPGDVGVVEEAVPLATGAAVEEGGGVDAMMMSPGRSSKPSQRLLS